MKLGIFLKYFMTMAITYAIVVFLIIAYGATNSEPIADVVETDNRVAYMSFKTDSIKISKCLKKLVEDYIVEANKYDIDLGELSKTSFIAHTDIRRYHHKNAYGITYVNRKDNVNHIMIDASVSHITQTFVKVVLYHELFHLISGKGHVNSGDYPYILRSGPRINVEYAISNFGKAEIREYFQFLKKVQTNKIKM
tara:strand:- start:816 stop:1400 length:585 start_codon:yes stop_codon:yes gene_type:complete